MTTEKREELPCESCRKLTSEYCSGLYCRACHKSITFEDCVNQTTPEELEWKARKLAAMREPQEKVQP